MNIVMIHPHDIYSNSEPWTVRSAYYIYRKGNYREIYEDF